MDREQLLEGSFYRYMHHSGEVDPAWNREVLSQYVPYFAQCQRVLDVGCGQGDFLELLDETGVEGVGVDVDTGMVDICLRKGLHVVQGDVFDYLPESQERFDGIFSSNLIEHLSAAEATRFVRLAFDSLSPGGLFLVATPNPASPIVHLHEFWRDATHVRLYNRSLLEFLLDWAGFVEVQSDENAVTAWEPSDALQAVPGRFQELALLRGAIRRGVKVKRPARLGEGLSPVHAVSWNRSRDEKITNCDRRSFWGRLVFSLRRRLARFLADTVLFEEFASLSVFSDGLSDLGWALHDTWHELTRVNSALSEKSSVLDSMSLATQEIEKVLYRSQYRMMTTPREVFATGVKPLVRGKETE